MVKLQKLFGQTVIYGLSSILGRTLNYFLVPLYTSVFLPEKYGIVTEIYAFIAFLNVIYTFGLETTYFRFATKYPRDKDRYFSLSLVFLLFLALSLSSVFILFSDEIAREMQYEGFGYVIRWTAWIMAIDALVAVPFAQLRLNQRPVKFAVFKLGNIGVNLFLNIFFLVLLPNYLLVSEPSFWDTFYNPDLGVGYVFLSNLIANALYLIFFLPDLVRIRVDFLDLQIRKFFNYAFPLVILGLAGVTNEMFSRALLKYLLPQGYYANLSNQAVLGIFGACYKLAIFMTLAIQAFKYAYEPFFFKQASESGDTTVYARIMHAFIVFGVSAWLLISMLLPELGMIFLQNPIYQTGLKIVPWLLGGGLFLGIYYNLSVWYKVTDRTWYGAYISLSGAAITILLNFLLIPYFGYMGSAYATFFTYFAMMLISFFWGRKFFFVPYSVGKDGLFIVLGSLGAAIIAQFMYSEWRWLINGVVLAVFLLFLFFSEKLSRR